jgi:glycosyltransferase involved in cell wall biosynthesis
MSNDDSTEIVSIVVPVYNEEDNLPEFLHRAQGVNGLLAKQNLQLEVVIVDDHSSDRTQEVARELMRTHDRIQYMRLSRNCGSHSAIAAGMLACKGDCAIAMAVDLQDPPELIPLLVERWQAGHDVVWAGRSHREGESFSRLFFSGLYYRLMSICGLPEMPEKGADVVLVDRKVIDAYNAIPEKHTSILGMILWMGFRQTSIEYIKQARRSGRSKWTLAKKVKLAIDSIVSFSYLPIRVMTIFGFFMASAGMVYATIVVIGRLLGWVSAGTGFAALMTVVLVGQGAILLMLGILGEYLWRTFDESRGRPRYIVETHATSSTLKTSMSGTTD